MSHLNNITFNAAIFPLYHDFDPLYKCTWRWRAGAETEKSILFPFGVGFWIIQQLSFSESSRRLLNNWFYFLQQAPVFFGSTNYIFLHIFFSSAAQQTETFQYIVPTLETTTDMQVHWKVTCTPIFQSWKFSPLLMLALASLERKLKSDFLVAVIFAKLYRAGAKVVHCRLLYKAAKEIFWNVDNS